MRISGGCIFIRWAIVYDFTPVKLLGAGGPWLKEPMIDPSLETHWNSYFLQT